MGLHRPERVVLIARQADPLPTLGTTLHHHQAGLLACNISTSPLWLCPHAVRQGGGVILHCGVVVILPTEWSQKVGVLTSRHERELCGSGNLCQAVS